jgi:lipopolysaccharide export system protein LptA
MTRLHALLIAAMLASSPVFAAETKTPFGDLGDSSDQPISIKADTQAADFTAETITYSGDVVIQQGEMILRADAVMAEAPKSTLTRITASGTVIITSKDATARAPKAVYDVSVRTIHLSGGVVLTQGGNTLRGTDLLVDLKANTATLTSSGGRVEGILQPGDAKTK